MSSNVSFVSSPKFTFQRPCLIRPLRATFGGAAPPLGAGGWLVAGTDAKTPAASAAAPRNSLLFMDASPRTAAHLMTCGRRAESGRGDRAAPGRASAVGAHS